MSKQCNYIDCKKPVKPRHNYCRFHKNSRNANNFLSNLYGNIKRRVTTGGNTDCPHLYVGKPVMPKDAFMVWSKNHPDFLRLYKQWVTFNFDRKLTPVVNRLNSSLGYTLDNVEWITASQNSVLAASVRKTNAKARKEIYNLLGVNNNVKEVKEKVA